MYNKGYHSPANAFKVKKFHIFPFLPFTFLNNNEFFNSLHEWCVNLTLLEPVELIKW